MLRLEGLELEGAGVGMFIARGRVGAQRTEEEEAFS